MGKIAIKKERLFEIWNKYALIVVGNIVFFCLLYFISYRPHNNENRAGEFLSMAQSAETRGLSEAAVELYGKVIKDYPSTRAGQTAKTQLAGLKLRLSKQPQEVPQCTTRCEEINIEEMLRKGPSVYIATYLARHYKRVPADKAKLKDVISEYLGNIVNREGGDLGELKKESEFRDPIMVRDFFDIRPICTMTADWIYDDFSIKNDNFYAWHNANVTITVTQGAAQSSETIRVAHWPPGESRHLLDFRVRASSGVVNCKMEITSREGRASSVTDI